MSAIDLEQRTAVSRVSQLSQELRGSEILRIAAEVREFAAAGNRVVNLTVGDFSPKEFPIPKELEDATVDALRAGESNYPPSNGLESLRVAVQAFYEREFGRRHPLDQILITSGARPAIYALFRAVVDPGDRVIYGAPSWNNDYYCVLVGAEPVVIDCGDRTNFLLTRDVLRDAIGGARFLSLNSPLNPTGTVFDSENLADICDLVLEENERREARRERPLFVMYDQVYWMLTVGGATHVDPISLRPQIAPYVVMVDAISKAFAATGLRVGWAIGPSDIIKPMGDIVTHMGAWAPRPEQLATAKLLNNPAAVTRFIQQMRSEAALRLEALYAGLREMRDAGLPVDCVRPQGAIYVSAQFALHGRRTADGSALETDDDVRRYLLTEAGVAAVPFGAFGAQGGDGWFRLSIGAVSVAQIRESLERIRGAMNRLLPSSGVKNSTTS
jgi:aspartate aminotransferase